MLGIYTGIILAQYEFALYFEKTLQGAIINTNSYGINLKLNPKEFNSLKLKERQQLVSPTSDPKDLFMKLIICPSFYNTYTKHNNECMFVYVNDCRQDIY